MRFDAARQAYLEGRIAYLTDTIRLMLIDESVDIPVLSTDVYFSDILSGARKGNGGASTRAACPILTGKTTSAAGVADANDVVVTSVPIGPALKSIVLFKDSGADGTSMLLEYINQGGGLSGAGTTPNGLDIHINWPNTAGKIFKL